MKNSLPGFPIHAAVLAIALFITGCSKPRSSNPPTASNDKAALNDSNLAKATFAGGCFWCLEPPLEKLDGVEAVISGYTGGPEVDPTYEQVSSGRTGHREAVQVLYDPAKVSYEKILETLWRQINPTDPGGQFADRGPQYATGIFYHDEAQREAAEKSKQLIADSGLFDQPIVTPIEPASPFYPAEDYHQDFYKKDPYRYKSYRYGSGRDGFISKTWDTRPDLFSESASQSGS